MQIHELTQPKKIKLDEVDIVGPDGVWSKLKSVVKNPASLVSASAAGAAAQDRYKNLAARNFLDLSLKKLKNNPQAQQVINDMVANWPPTTNQPSTTPAVTTTPTTTPAVQNATLGGKRLDPKNPNDARVLAALAKQGIKEAPEYTTPGGIVVPANSKTDQTPATQLDPKQSLKAWIDSQLKTISLEKLEKIPGLAAKLETLIDQVVSKTGNIPAQQKILHTIFSLATAGKDAILTQEPPKSNKSIASGSNTGSTTAVDLSPQTLYNLKQQARATGGPRPAKTNNAFLNALVDKIWG